MVIANRWVEAEDRPNKRPGAFCTGFPDSGQTRVFMTYSGTSSNVSTLAHELGHAFHQYVMEDLPPFAQNYAMNVAETASTLAELIVSDASLKAASNKEERIALLDEKVERAVSFFMNIHARFIFETNFYEERKQGLVSVERLNQLMTEAQRTAYKDALAEYHPHFWASKLHFYITEVPFYNFPYTFGFLFSSGIYATALAQGSSFEDHYIALLRDTGRMQVEELAKRHLGVDLTKPDFWQRAVDVSVADAKEFLSLTE
jgi:oligoendopeptidase F